MRRLPYIVPRLGGASIRKNSSSKQVGGDRRHHNVSVNPGGTSVGGTSVGGTSVNVSNPANGPPQSTTPAEFWPLLYQVLNKFLVSGNRDEIKNYYSTTLPPDGDVPARRRRGRPFKHPQQEYSENEEDQQGEPMDTTRQFKKPPPPPGPIDPFERTPSPMEVTNSSNRKPPPPPPPEGGISNEEIRYDPNDNEYHDDDDLFNQNLAGDYPYQPPPPPPVAAARQSYISPLNREERENENVDDDDRERFVLRNNNGDHQPPPPPPPGQGGERIPIQPPPQPSSFDHNDYITPEVRDPDNLLLTDELWERLQNFTSNYLNQRLADRPYGSRPVEFTEQDMEFLTRPPESVLGEDLVSVYNDDTEYADFDDRLRSLRSQNNISQEYLQKLVNAKFEGLLTREEFNNNAQHFVTKNELPKPGNYIERSEFDKERSAQNKRHRESKQLFERGLDGLNEDLGDLRNVTRDTFAQFVDGVGPEETIEDIRGRLGTQILRREDQLNQMSTYLYGNTHPRELNQIFMNLKDSISRGNVDDLRNISQRQDDDLRQLRREFTDAERERLAAEQRINAEHTQTRDTFANQFQEVGKTTDRIDRRMEGLGSEVGQAIGHLKNEPRMNVIQQYLPEEQLQHINRYVGSLSQAEQSIAQHLESRLQGFEQNIQQGVGVIQNLANLQEQMVNAQVPIQIDKVVLNELIEESQALKDNATEILDLKKKLVDTGGQLEGLRNIIPPPAAALKRVRKQPIVTKPPLSAIEPPPPPPSVVEPTPSTSTEKALPSTSSIVQSTPSPNPNTSLAELIETIQETVRDAIQPIYETLVPNKPGVDNPNIIREGVFVPREKDDPNRLGAIPRKSIHPQNDESIDYGPSPDIGYYQRPLGQDPFREMENGSIRDPRELSVLGRLAHEVGRPSRNRQPQTTPMRLTKAREHQAVQRRHSVAMLRPMLDQLDEKEDEDDVGGVPLKKNPNQQIVQQELPQGNLEYPDMSRMAARVLPQPAPPPVRDRRMSMQHTFALPKKLTEHDYETMRTNPMIIRKRSSVDVPEISKSGVVQQIPKRRILEPRHQVNTKQDELEDRISTVVNTIQRLAGENIPGITPHATTFSPIKANIAPNIVQQVLGGDQRAITEIPFNPNEAPDLSAQEDDIPSSSAEGGEDPSADASGEQAQGRNRRDYFYAQPKMMKTPPNPFMNFKMFIRPRSSKLNDPNNSHHYRSRHEILIEPDISDDVEFSRVDDGTLFEKLMNSSSNEENDKENFVEKIPERGARFLTNMLRGVNLERGDQIVREEDPVSLAYMVSAGKRHSMHPGVFKLINSFHEGGEENLSDEWIIYTKKKLAAMAKNDPKKKELYQYLFNRSGKNHGFLINPENDEIYLRAPSKDGSHYYHQSTNTNVKKLPLLFRRIGRQNCPILHRLIESLLTVHNNDVQPYHKHFLHEIPKIGSRRMIRYYLRRKRNDEEDEPGRIA